MRIGIDFGGVLTDTTSPPTENYLTVPPQPRAIETLMGWRRDGHDVTIISKASTPEKEAKAREWLRLNGLYNILGKDKAIFCAEKSGKIALCQAAEIDLMVDDTYDQLLLLQKTVPKLVLFNSVELPEGAPDTMHVAEDWLATDRIVSHTIQQP